MKFIWKAEVLNCFSGENVDTSDVKTGPSSQIHKLTLRGSIKKLEIPIPSMHFLFWGFFWGFVVGFFSAKKQMAVFLGKCFIKTGHLWAHVEITKSLEKRWTFKQISNKMALSRKRVRCHRFIIYNKKGADKKIL